MATYKDELLGASPTLANGKDGVLAPNILGTTIDYYQEPLVAGIRYTIAAFGVSNGGGTLRDPAVAIFNSRGQIVAVQYDGPPKVPTLAEQSQNPFFLFDGTLQSQPGKDPIFYFTPSVGDNYFIGVFDQTRLGGTYLLSVTGSGAPLPGGGTSFIR
jgi:hypothetical protein